VGEANRNARGELGDLGIKKKKTAAGEAMITNAQKMQKKINQKPINQGKK